MESSAVGLLWPVRVFQGSPGLFVVANGATSKNNISKNLQYHESTASISGMQNAMSYKTADIKSAIFR